jgi:oxygen-independent coproporphyrinogen-3 oxidase
VPPNHLYVHVPFCARRCSYCDFSIAVRATTPVDEYLTALRAELEATVRERWTLDTVYLGGGTPSRLGGSGVARLLETIRERATIEPAAEITIEANPDDVTPEAATAWLDAGVNRISLGAQSFDDAVLEWMHRTHDASQTADAVRTLRAAGIENISLDLIFSLPAHLNRSWESDVDRALELAPSHLSLYGLTVERQTPIARWADRGSIVEGTEEKYAAEFLYAHETMSRAGFEHYEVSNFACPNRASRHNSAYWTGVPYAGLGPSAHSFDGTSRWWNVSAYANWVSKLTAGQSITAGDERLSEENRDTEAVYLGLRTRRGLVVDESDLATVQSWVGEGWAELEGLRLRLTPTGWLRLDSLAASIAARRADHGFALSKSA